MATLFRWRVKGAEMLIGLRRPGELADLACGNCRSWLASEQGHQLVFLDHCPGCEALGLDALRDRLVADYGLDRRFWPPEIRTSAVLLTLAAEVIRGEGSPNPDHLYQAVAHLDRLGHHVAADLLRQLLPQAAADLAA